MFIDSTYNKQSLPWIEKSSPNREGLLDFFETVRNVRQVHSPIALRSGKHLTTCWKRTRGWRDLQEVLADTRLTTGLRSRWVNSLVDMVSAIGTEYIEFFPEFGLRVDTRGRLRLDSSNCLKSHGFNVRNAMELKSEHLMWSLSSSLPTAVRREFLAQQWLAERVYQILAPGEAPYRANDRNTLRWFADFTSRPAYREPLGVSPAVADVLREMLAFTRKRRYRNLNQAVAALRRALLQTEMEDAA
jgi:hypothetical protein